MDSGYLKAARQGHWRLSELVITQGNFSAPPGAICQSWLDFKASPAINNRVNQLATGCCLGVKISVNHEHSSSSYVPLCECLNILLCLWLRLQLLGWNIYTFILVIHINLQAQKLIQSRKKLLMGMLLERRATYKHKHLHHNGIYSAFLTNNCKNTCIIKMM